MEPIGIMVRIISTAPPIGNTIDTAGIGPTGLFGPSIILTHVIIITGQTRVARGSPKYQTRFAFASIWHHVDGTHLTTTSSIAT